MPDDFDIDVAEAEELREVVKQLLKSKEHGNDSGRKIPDKFVGKPIPWDGEQEAEFKAWEEKLSMFMSTVFDKSWKKIFKKLNKMEDEELEDCDDIDEFMDNLGLDSDKAEDMQEVLYDQLTQYTKGELLADIQMAGPDNSFESYRRAYAYGKKKTAENVHRARNRVTRPEIAETMDDLEEKYKKWKKDVAYLKDIDAYDFGEAGMVSILLDMIPDEVHKEITVKHKTTGKRAAGLKQIMIEVEKIIVREKDRKQSRADRKPETNPKKKINYAGKGNADEEQELYVWDQEHGGFIMMAKRARVERVDEEDEEERPGKRMREQEEPSARPKGKGKGKSKGDRKCFTCGEEGHYKAQCPHRYYMPKTVWGSWWSSLPFAKGKGKGKGEGKGKGKGKGKGQYVAPAMNMMEEYSQDWWAEGAHEADSGEWRQIGMLSRSCRCKPKDETKKETQKNNSFESTNRFAVLGDFIQQEAADKEDAQENTTYKSSSAEKGNLQKFKRRKTQFTKDQAPKNAEDGDLIQQKAADREDAQENATYKSSSAEKGNLQKFKRRKRTLQKFKRRKTQRTRTRRGKSSRSRATRTLTRPSRSTRCRPARRPHRSSTRH